MVNKAIISLLIFSLLISVTYSYSDGAPQSVCGDFTPGHGLPIQTTDCPVLIETPEFYTPGEEISVTVRAVGASNFKGFLAAIREVDEDGVVFRIADGDFRIGDPATQQRTCYSRAMTHRNGSPKNTTSFGWTPSSTYQNRSLAVWVTVVESYTTYWVGCSRPLNPTTTKAQTDEEASTTTSSSTSTSTMTPTTTPTMTPTATTVVIITTEYTDPTTPRTNSSTMEGISTVEPFSSSSNSPSSTRTETHSSPTTAAVGQGTPFTESPLVPSSSTTVASSASSTATGTIQSTSQLPTTNTSTTSSSTTPETPTTSTATVSTRHDYTPASTSSAANETSPGTDAGSSSPSSTNTKLDTASASTQTADSIAETSIAANNKVTTGKMVILPEKTDVKAPSSFNSGCVLSWSTFSGILLLTAQALFRG